MQAFSTIRIQECLQFQMNRIFYLVDDVNDLVSIFDRKYTINVPTIYIHTVQPRQRESAIQHLVRMTTEHRM